MLLKGKAYPDLPIAFYGITFGVGQSNQSAAQFGGLWRSHGQRYSVYNPKRTIRIAATHDPKALKSVRTGYGTAGSLRGGRVLPGDNGTDLDVRHCQTRRDVHPGEVEPIESESSQQALDRRKPRPPGSL